MFPLFVASVRHQVEWLREQVASDRLGGTVVIEEASDLSG
jgi:hypothetical protein